MRISDWSSDVCSSDLVSRLSAPLVNEVIIGLPDKDRFNGSAPRYDGKFAKYVTNPSLPELIQVLYPGVTAPNLFRSEERRVGKACVSTCRSRWSPDH